MGIPEKKPADAREALDFQGSSLQEALGRASGGTDGRVAGICRRFSVSPPGTSGGGNHWEVTKPGGDTRVSRGARVTRVSRPVTSCRLSQAP